MTDIERTDLIRRYTDAEVSWSALGARGALGLRAPIAPMDGPSVAARERGRALIREAFLATKRHVARASSSPMPRC